MCNKGCDSFLITIRKSVNRNKTLTPEPQLSCFHSIQELPVNKAGKIECRPLHRELIDYY